MMFRSPSLPLMILAVFVCGLALLRTVVAFRCAEAIDTESRAVGIIFGSSHASVGYDVNGTITFIPDKQNQTSIPTCVAFTETGEPFIGEAAKSQLLTHPQRTVCNLKDLLHNSTDNVTTRMDEAVNERELTSVQILLPDGKKMYTPEELAGLFFRGLKDIATEFIGQDVRTALSSVGVASSNSDQDPLKRALELGGFECVRVSNEGIFAGVAYGLDDIYDWRNDGTHVLFYNIGPRAVEINIMLVEEGVFDVLKTLKDSSINDEILHRELVVRVKELYPELEDVDPSLLADEMQSVKGILSSQDTAQFSVGILHTDRFVRGTVTRETFNDILAPYIPRILSSMKQVVHNANLTVYDVSEIVPIGGAAITPALQAHLLDYFPSTIKLHSTIPPQDVIVHGLSKMLGWYHDTGTLIGNYEIAIQALGVRTAGDLATPVIRRMSMLPSQESRTFTTVRDNQKRAIIEIYEGDRHTVGNNTVLGRIEVEDIPPAKRGVPKIEVTVKLPHSLTNPYEVVVTLVGRDGEQSMTGHLPYHSYVDLVAISQIFEDNVDEDLIIRAELEVQLARGRIPIQDTDVVEVDHVWYTE